MSASNTMIFDICQQDDDGQLLIVESGFTNVEKVYSSLGEMRRQNPGAIFSVHTSVLVP